MAIKPGINVPIYKIDIEAVNEFFDEELIAETIPARLVARYNEEKTEVVYESKGSATIDGCYVELFHNIKSAPNASSWIKYFQESGIELPEIKNQLQHLLCFSVIDGELYAYTAGQSVVVFERFIDIAFPIEVGRRIAKAEIKAARANQITGTTLASDLHFRDPRRITYTESLDTVWTALSGQLRDTVLDKKALADIFGAKSKMKIDITSAVRLGPKVESPAKMIELIRWLAEQAEGPLPKDDGLAALDAIKVLNPRKKKDLIAKLRTALAEQIFKAKSYENLALAHVDASLYSNATHYAVEQGRELKWDGSEEPTLDDVISAVLIDTDNYCKNLTEIMIRTTNDEYGSAFGTYGNLLAHLNGELRFGGKTYFLIGGKWYEVDASYITEITKDFLNLIEGLDLPASTIGLRNWQNDENEGQYNETSLTHDFINGDKVLTDNVELFDTLSYRGGETHILHVKRGFNVKVRDVRSQLLLSAQIIENDLRNGGAKLREHHAQLLAKGRTQLTEDEFMKLFERPRVYALCYATKSKVKRSNIGSFKSSVAKMEVVSLNNQFRQVSSIETNASFRISWVKIVD